MTSPRSRRTWVFRKKMETRRLAPPPCSLPDDNTGTRDIELDEVMSHYLYCLAALSRLRPGSFATATALSVLHLSIPAVRKSASSAKAGASRPTRRAFTRTRSRSLTSTPIPSSRKSPWCEAIAPRRVRQELTTASGAPAACSRAAHRAR
jgi:hypothetical protein